jgi:hypothetical protein
MAKELSDETVMAQGVAAYALISSTLKYLEAIGVKPEDVVTIIAMAEDHLAKVQEVRSHRAMPEAVKQLREAARQVLKASGTSSRH